MSWLDLGEINVSYLESWAGVAATLNSPPGGGYGGGSVLDTELEFLEALGKLVHKLGLHRPAGNRGCHG